MGIDALLSRLDGLRQGSGPDRWIARCPAHDDRSPSLSVRLADNGSILVKCFADCSAIDIMGTLGLSMTDLFPEPLTKTFLPRIRAPFSAMDVLRCLTRESSIVALAASDILEGKPLSDEFLERLSTASGRIATALEVTHG